MWVVIGALDAGAVLHKKRKGPFVELRELTEPLVQEWKFYSPKYGWSFKVFQKKKALFYLTPNAGRFSFGMALRENERALVLASGVSQKIKETLAAETKVMEGYPLRLTVTSGRQLAGIKKVLKVLDEARGLGLFDEV
jgi:hypothetical protein